MENNENNVQNQEKKQSKGLSVGLVIIMLIAVLIIGIGGGYLLSKNNSLFNKNKAKSNSNNSNTTQSNNTIEQSKASKKIDESKPWVYDMNIEEKEFEFEYEDGKDNYKSSENFKVPYININSEDAEQVNKEILSVYNNAIQNFGKIQSEGARTISGIEYNAYENGKYLSVVLTESFGYVNGSSSKISEYAYTFNLDTLKQVTFKEVYKDKGYEEKNIEERINKFVEQAKKDISGGPQDNNSSIYFNNNFYIDNQGKIKILIANKHIEWNKTVLTYLTYDIDDTIINQNNVISNQTKSSNQNEQVLYTYSSGDNAAANGNGEYLYVYEMNNDIIKFKYHTPWNANDISGTATKTSQDLYVYEKDNYKIEILLNSMGENSVKVSEYNNGTLGSWKNLWK